MVPTTLPLTESAATPPVPSRVGSKLPCLIYADVRTFQHDVTGDAHLYNARHATTGIDMAVTVRSSVTTLSPPLPLSLFSPAPVTVR